MSWNTGLARIGAVLYVLWGLVHYSAAYGVYQLAQSTPLTIEHGRLQQLAFYLASFATAGIAFATLNWRNSALGFWFNAVVLGIGDTSSRFRASVARDCRSASVDRRLGLHRNRSGADVRHSQWGETRKVKMLTSWFLAETDLFGSKVVAEHLPRPRRAASSVHKRRPSFSACLSPTATRARARLSCRDYPLLPFRRRGFCFEVRAKKVDQCT